MKDLMIGLLYKIINILNQTLDLLWV